MSKLCTQIIKQFTEGTSFHASLGRTGMKKRASFEIFVRQIRTTVRKWELWKSSHFSFPSFLRFISNWNKTAQGYYCPEEPTPVQLTEETNGCKVS